MGGTVTQTPGPHAAPRDAGIARYVAAVLLGSMGVAARAWRLTADPSIPLRYLALGLVVALVVAPPRPLRHIAIRLVLAAAVVGALVAATAGATLLAAGTLVASTVVATGAVVRWRPLPRWPQRSAPVASLAVGPLIVADISWVRTARPSIQLVLLAAALVLIEAYARAPRLVQRVDEAVGRGAEAVARGLSWVLAVIAWVLIVLPLWAVGRVTRYSPLDLGWATSETAWLTRTSQRSGSNEPVDARHLGTAELAPTRGVKWRSRLRAVPIVAVLLLLAVPVVQNRTGGTDAVLDVRAGADSDGEITWGGEPVEPSAFADEPWADALFEDLELSGGSEDRIVGARLKDYDGEYVSISGGVRNSFVVEDPELSVWFFGGSTMFGVGQRDEHTIPSDIARLALEDGLRLDVTNFGVSGDVNWQEVIRYAEALQEREPPDLVVFYDGWNDMSLGYVGSRDPEANPAIGRRLPQTEAEQKEDLARQDGVYTPLQRQQAIAFTVRQYDRGMAVASQLSEANDVEVAAFWQPILCTKKWSEADRKLMDHLGLDPGLFRLDGDTQQQAGKASSANPVDLTEALDDVTEPVFFDHGHNNERGAQLVAEVLYAELLPQLRELAGS